MSHRSPDMSKPEYRLEINEATSWYLNTEDVPHLQLVVPYVNGSKSDAAAKEVHEFWTMLVTTATETN